MQHRIRLETLKELLAVALSTVFAKVLLRGHDAYILKPMDIYGHVWG